MAWLWLQCSSCIFISIRFSGTLCIHRVYSTSLCAFQFVLVDIEIFVGLGMLFRCSLEKHCSGVKIGNVGVFFWLNVCSLPFLPHSSPFFLLMISMQKPKKLLYCLFSSVEFIYFRSICFVLSVWQCVQLYPNTMGMHHMEHKLLSLSLSLAPLDLSVIWCRCTWISIFLSELYLLLSLFSNSSFSVSSHLNLCVSQSLP